MPRKKAVQNMLTDLPDENVNGLITEESDDVVLGELSEEEREKAEKYLEEMDANNKTMASRRRKKNLYRPNRDGIITMDDDDLEDLVMQEDIRYETFSKLNAAMIGRSYVKGRVFKALSRNTTDASPLMPTAIVTMDDDDYFKIAIPITDFLPKNTLEDVRGESARDKLNYMDLLINNRKGAEVYFMVKSLNEQTGEVIGSRTEAMRRITREKWFARKRDDTFVINAGDDLRANVQVVTRSNIIVDAFGIEQILDVNEVSWLRYSDLTTAPLKKERVPGTREIVTTAYQAGDKILVRVVGIKRVMVDRDGNKYSETECIGKSGLRPYGMAVKLSAKACVANPDEVYFDDFAVGDKVNAVVTHVDQNGIFCKLSDRRSGLVYYRESTYIPTPGDRILVRVVKKDPKDYKIACELIRIN